MFFNELKVSSRIQNREIRQKIGVSTYKNRCFYVLFILKDEATFKR